MIKTVARFATRSDHRSPQGRNPFSPKSNGSLTWLPFPHYLAEYPGPSLKYLAFTAISGRRSTVWPTFRIMV
jgi:hypothetical protein